MVLLIYSGALDREVDAILDDAGIEGYTKLLKVFGRGRSSGPHLGTHVWPKVNYMMWIFTEGDPLRLLLAGIRKLREQMGREGVKAFLLPCEEVTSGADLP